VFKILYFLCITQKGIRYIKMLTFGEIVVLNVIQFKYSLQKFGKAILQLTLVEWRSTFYTTKPVCTSHNRTVYLYLKIAHPATLNFNVSCDYDTTRI